MTEEEYFRKNYPNSCYGDKPLSPHWDFFQDGVEFGERQSEKRIEELERKLEQTEKDLADYQFNYPTIKELQKENAELKEKNNNLVASSKTIISLSDEIETRVMEQLTKAKELLEKLLLVSCNSEVLNQYPNCSKVLQARVEAEQFLYSEVAK